MTRQDYLDIRSSTYAICRLSVKTLLSSVVIGFIGSIALVGQSEAATLKADSMVTDEVVHLGDLFDGVEHPETVLGAAPQLGKSMTINTAILRRIANNFAVNWTPITPTDQITIKRDAHVVTQDMITSVLKTTLAGKGLDGNFDMQLTNAENGIILPANIDATVEVASLNYTPGSPVFTATLASPSAEKPFKTLQISGLINRLVSVPSLVGNARQGDIISASDIAWIDVPERFVTKDTITDADDIIGKTPMSVLAGKRAIKMNEVVNPKLVSRGDDVTILYALGGMTLSARGKSQQNGSQGDIIRVTNLSSSKSMSAVITGDRQVTIQ